MLTYGETNSNACFGHVSVQVVISSYSALLNDFVRATVARTGGGASGYSNNLNNRVLDTVGDMTKALKEDADTKAD